MASPNPERELERLSALLAQQAPAVLLLRGPGRWFRERALALVLERRRATHELRTLDGEDPEAEARFPEFLTDLRSAPLFARGQLLCLKRADRILQRFGGALADTIPRIAAGNGLIVDCTRLDGRGQLAKAFRAHGSVFEFRDLYERPFRDDQPRESAEIVRWLAGRSRAHGITLTPAGAVFMVDAVGADPAKLDNELARLAAAGLRGRVDRDELRGRLTISFEASQFGVVEALLDGDLKGALRHNRALFREGLRDRDGRPLDRGAVFPIVLAWLRKSLETLQRARRRVDGGEALERVAAEEGGTFRSRFARHLARHDRASLARLERAVVAAEERLRSLGEDPELILERLVTEVCLPGHRPLLAAHRRAEWF